MGEGEMKKQKKASHDCISTVTVYCNIIHWNFIKLAISLHGVVKYHKTNKGEIYVVRPGCREHRRRQSTCLYCFSPCTKWQQQKSDWKSQKKMHLIIVQDVNNVITLTGEWLCRSTCLSHASAEQRFAKSNSRLKLIPSQCSLDFSFSFCIAWTWQQ